MHQLPVRATLVVALLASTLFVFASSRQPAAAATSATVPLAAEAVSWPAPAEPLDTTVITPAESVGA